MKFPNKIENPVAVFSLFAAFILCALLLRPAFSAPPATPPHQAYHYYPDLRYENIGGVDPDLLSLDLYAPLSGSNHPILIYIHGGSLNAGDKRPVIIKGSAFTKKGWVFASINYRLTPPAKYPTHVQDVAKAIAFIHKNATKYGGDPDRIYLLGHSSGAHLAALVATDERFLKAQGLPLSAIKGVIGLDEEGYDIPAVQKFEPDLMSALYIPSFGSAPKVWREASPVSHIAPGKGIPPFLLFHLGGEMQQFMAEEMAKKLKAAGVEVEVVPIDSSCTHMGLTNNIGTRNDPTTNLIFKFLDKQNIKLDQTARAK
jgi:acetyl esterase/lipase